MQERRDETGVGATIEVVALRERRWRIERDNDDGDDDDGEKDNQKINSKSTFCPPQSRKGAITYSTCVLGVRLCYRRHGKQVVTELKKHGDTRYIGGLGPCSLYLIFSSDLVKIYLVNPYTVRKISSSSISW